MLSKRQAEAASAALLESERKRRDRASPLLARFPELADVAFEERAALVKEAHRAAWRRWPMLVALGGIVAVAAVWVWAVIMKLEIANGAWWAPFLAAFSLHQVSQSLVRRELRRLLLANESRAD